MNKLNAGDVVFLPGTVIAVHGAPETHEASRLTCHVQLQDGQGIHTHQSNAVPRESIQTRHVPKPGSTKAPRKPLTDEQKAARKAKRQAAAQKAKA